MTKTEVRRTRSTSFPRRGESTPRSLRRAPCHSERSEESRLVFSVLLSVPSARAQVVTGTPPFGSFTGPPDIINEASGNVHISIPIVSKAGRGLPFYYALAYDSSFWSTYNGGYGGAWSLTPYNSWGWTAQSAAELGNYTFAQTQLCCPGQHCNPGSWNRHIL